MNLCQINFRRLFVVFGLTGGIFVLWNKVSPGQDGQHAFAPGLFILVEDKLYVVDYKLRDQVKPIPISWSDSRIFQNLPEPGTKRPNAVYAGFAVNANGQLVLTKDPKQERPLKRRLLEDTRNPKLDAMDLKASSWRIVYAFEVDPLEGPNAPPPPEKRHAVVAAAETVEVALTPEKKIAARPVLLRAVQNGDTLLKFEVRYTSGK